MKNFTVSVDATVVISVEAEDLSDASEKAQEVLDAYDIESRLADRVNELVEFSDVWLGSIYLIKDDESGEELNT